ncbi:MAG: ribbon-helix-helix protein, CopG family [Solirubrobacteraceae bacterium]
MSAPLLNFRCPAPVREAIDALAAQAGVNRSQFVRAAVVEMSRQDSAVVRERVAALAGQPDGAVLRRVAEVTGKAARPQG